MPEKKRSDLKRIGIKDRTGRDIVIGDIFEYENIYIISEDPYDENHYIVREFENIYEYGVEKEPYYQHIEDHEITDLELHNDQVKGNIFIDRTELKDQIHY